MVAKPTNETNIIYTIKNANPPLAPILYGNPQILPKPTAEPIAAIKNPKLLPHWPLLSLFIYTPSLIFLMDMIAVLY